MIPNTDINCGKCAAPIYSDCVMWSGGNLSCVTLLQDCCDTTLTKVVELLGAYVCNLSNVANYNIPVCMESYNITDFVGMQNAMMELICNQQASITLSAITWGCVASGTTVEDALQNIITEVNSQTLEFNQSQFEITGTTCSNRGVSLIQPCWTVGTERAFGEWSYQTTLGRINGLYYMLDSLGNVRLSAILVYGSPSVLTNAGWQQLIQLPVAITPAQSSVGNHFTCTAYVSNSNSFPTITGTNNYTRVAYNNGSGSTPVDVPRSVILHGKIDSSGWVWVEIPYNQGYWEVWLHSVNYNINGAC